MAKKERQSKTASSHKKPTETQPHSILYKQRYKIEIIREKAEGEGNTDYLKSSIIGKLFPDEQEYQRQAWRFIIEDPFGSPIVGFYQTILTLDQICRQIADLAQSRIFELLNEQLKQQKLSEVEKEDLIKRRCGQANRMLQFYTHLAANRFTKTFPQAIKDAISAHIHEVFARTLYDFGELPFPDEQNEFICLAKAASEEFTQAVNLLLTCGASEITG